MEIIVTCAVKQIVHFVTLTLVRFILFITFSYINNEKKAINVFPGDSFVMLKSYIYFFSCRYTCSLHNDFPTVPQLPIFHQVLTLYLRDMSVWYFHFFSCINSGAKSPEIDHRRVFSSDNSWIMDRQGEGWEEGRIGVYQNLSVIIGIIYSKILYFLGQTVYILTDILMSCFVKQSDLVKRLV